MIKHLEKAEGCMGREIRRDAYFETGKRYQGRTCRLAKAVYLTTMLVGAAVRLYELTEWPL